jgi:hypothetical protein
MSSWRKSAWIRSLPIVAAAVAVGLCFPPESGAWGNAAERQIVNKAVDTLPPELRPFFEANRGFLTQHATDPFESLAKNPAERRNHILFLDRYGRFPYESLPRSYKAALAKFGKAKLEASGLLPWQIGVYSEKLTTALKASKWEEAKLAAAHLAYYVSQAHDPFHTTENFDGHLSSQLGVNDRFSTSLVDRYGSFFPLRPNDALFINDPTDHAFDACLSAHAWLEQILLADRRTRAGLPAYNDEFYDRFYSQAAAILIRQLSDASTDVGSYWLTAWINAGRPALPQN